MLSKARQRVPLSRRPRHADGQPDAPVLDARHPLRRAAFARLPAAARPLLGENLIAFRTTSGAGRPDPERLPAPRRLDVLRPQRRRRPALRLPRLEVRHRRHLRRHAFRAGREQLQEQGAGHVPTRAASATASSGPTWARARRRRRCPTSKPTCSARARTRISMHAPPLQLDAGLGRRDGHGPRGLPALRRRRSVEDTEPGTFDYYQSRKRPRRKFSVIDTRLSATSYGAYRPAEEDTYYWRIAHILFPFYAMIPRRAGPRGRASRRTCRWTTSTRCTGRSAPRRLMEPDGLPPEPRRAARRGARSGAT